MLVISKRGVGMLQILGAATLWGTSGTFAKFLFNNQVVPADLAQARMTMSFLILFLVLGIFNHSLLRIQWRDMGFMALFGIAGLGLVQFSYLFAISATNVATAIFLQYLAPALILIYGLVRGIEQLSGAKFAALGLSLFGGYLIVVGTSSGFALATIGIIAGLVSALGFAFYTIYGKYGLEKYDSWTLLVWGMFFGALAWCFYQSPTVLITKYDSMGKLEFLYIAIAATVVPFGLYFKGLKNLSALRTNLIATLEPVIGAITAFLFLGETLSLLQILGCLSVLGGVVLIQYVHSHDLEGLIKESGNRTESG